MWRKYKIDHVWTGGTRHYAGGYHGVTSVLSHTRPEHATRRIDEWKSKRSKEEQEAPAIRGTNVHALVEQKLLGTLERIPEQYKPFLDSGENFFKLIAEIYLLEGSVWSPRGYAGTVDGVMSLRNPVDNVAHDYIVDFKTSDYLKSIRHDSKIQVAAYCGAVNRVYNKKINRGKIVMLHPKGDSVLYDIEPEEMSRHWNEWLKRLERYKQYRSA